MRRVILAAVSTVAALVLLLSFKTHSATSLATPPAAVASAVPSTGPTAAASASAAAPAASGSAGAPATTTKVAGPKAAVPSSQTVTGDAIDTRFGPVQVKITVTKGKLTAVDAIQYPQQEPMDQEINAYAIPVLTKEALAAGSAKIDSVSGATYTSEGYASSLQSALDKANL